VGLAAVAFGALVLGGCGDDDDGARTTSAEDGATTTTVAPAPTLDQLAAALPTEAELPDGYGFTTVCLAPADAGCLDDAESPYVSVAADNSSTSDLHEFFAVTAVLALDADRAAHQVSESRTDAARQDGSFDIAVENNADGTYTPGRRGEGHLGDAEIAGWKGYRLATTFEAIHPDGTTEPRQADGTLVLRRGDVVLTVQAAMPEAGNPSDALASRLDDWASTVISKL
jgi:hypothetical protein